MNYIIKNQKNVAITLINLEDFLKMCYSSGIVSGRIRYSFEQQKLILPNIITLSGILNAAMMEDDDPLLSFLPNVAFDAFEKFKNFSPLSATEFMYNNYLNETSGISKMNPGYDIPKNIFNPSLTRNIDPALIDFIVQISNLTSFSCLDVFH